MSVAKSHINGPPAELPRADSLRDLMREIDCEAFSDRDAEALLADAVIVLRSVFSLEEIGLIFAAIERQRPGTHRGNVQRREKRARRRFLDLTRQYYGLDVQQLAEIARHNGGLPDHKAGP